MASWFIWASRLLLETQVCKSCLRWGLKLYYLLWAIWIPRAPYPSVLSVHTSPRDLFKILGRHRSRRADYLLLQAIWVGGLEARSFYTPFQKAPISPLYLMGVVRVEHSPPSYALVRGFDVWGFRRTNLNLLRADASSL